MSNLFKTKVCLIIFSFLMFLSGITAFPLEQEIDYLLTTVQDRTTMQNWLTWVAEGIHNANSNYPFLSYGTDWLGFAHLLFTILFLGVVSDPIKNVWVINFGIIACILIIPTALIAGYFRHIPFFWQLIDISFGVIGLIPLTLSKNYINKQIAHEKHLAETH